MLECHKKATNKRAKGKKKRSKRCATCTNTKNKKEKKCLVKGKKSEEVTFFYTYQNNDVGSANHIFIVLSALGSVCSTPGQKSKSNEDNIEEDKTMKNKSDKK